MSSTIFLPVPNLQLSSLWPGALGLRLQHSHCLFLVTFRGRKAGSDVPKGGLHKAPLGKAGSQRYSFRDTDSPAPTPPPPGLRAWNPQGGSSCVPVNKRLGNFGNQPVCTSSGLEIRKFMAKGWRASFVRKYRTHRFFGASPALRISPLPCARARPAGFQAATSPCKVCGPFVRFCDSCGSRSAHSLHGAFMEKEIRWFTSVSSTVSFETVSGGGNWRNAPFYLQSAFIHTVLAISPHTMNLERSCQNPFLAIVP